MLTGFLAKRLDKNKDPALMSVHSIGSYNQQRIRLAIVSFCVKEIWNLWFYRESHIRTISWPCAVTSWRLPGGTRLYANIPTVEFIAYIQKYSFLTLADSDDA